MKTQEFAAKTQSEARALAARYGFTGAGFMYVCGPLCVLRFEVRP